MGLRVEVDVVVAAIVLEKGERGVLERLLGEYKDNVADARVKEVENGVELTVYFLNTAVTRIIKG